MDAIYFLNALIFIGSLILPVWHTKLTSEKWLQKKNPHDVIIMILQTGKNEFPRRTWTHHLCLYQQVTVVYIRQSYIPILFCTKLERKLWKP